MKTLVHIPWSLQPGFIGGTERFAIDLTKGLRKQGNDATIVCSNLEEQLIIEGVPVFGRIPAQYRDKVKNYGAADEHFFRNEVLRGSEPGFCERMSAYVAQQIEGFDFDIIHFNNMIGAAKLPPALLRRSIVSVHDCPEELTNYWKMPYETIRRAVDQNGELVQAGALVASTQHYAARFSADLNFTFAVIPLGVQPSAVTQSQRNPSEPPTILLPARFDVNQKGQDIAVRALSMLKAWNVPARMILSGYQPETYARDKKMIDTLIAECGAEEEITITRFERRSDAYAAADIVVSPERFCTFGLSIAESLAEGIPTVLAPIPTYQEITKGAPHASFAVDHTPLAFANALRTVIRSGYLRDPVAAKQFQADHSFATTVNRYSDLYAAVLRRAQ